MSRVRVYMACSLDGFVAGPDHDLAWLHAPPPEGSPPVEDSTALQFGDFMGQVGAMLMGRNTHDTVAAMGVEWPYGDVPVLVPTHRALTPAAPTVRAVSGDIADIVADAKAAAGDGDVYLDGGDLVRQALDAGLVDELCLTLVPILLAEGIPLFAGLRVRQDLVFVEEHRLGHMVQVTLRRREA